jgi:hypothetical protein
MVKDHYQGIPKKVPVLVDELGDAFTNTKNRVGYMVTGSGTLVDGYLAVVHADVGWHTMVITTPVSGTTTSGEVINYKIDAPNNTVMFSSFEGAGDFTYCLFNPGIGGEKK